LLETIRQPGCSSLNVIAGLEPAGYRTEPVDVSTARRSEFDVEYHPAPSVGFSGTGSMVEFAVPATESSKIGTIGECASASRIDRAALKNCASSNSCARRRSSPPDA